MRQKTIPIQKETFLTDQDAIAIWEEILLDQQERLIIAIDGPPGTGKSTLAAKLKTIIEENRIQVGIVATDLDCLPWAERPASTSSMDWHNDTLSKETILNPGANLLYTGYDPVTHKRTNTQLIDTPKNGILILEGLHSIEYARKYSNKPIAAIVFQISNELREIHRAERNVRHKRWKKEEVKSRTEAQRSSTVTYYQDLAKELQGTSTNTPNTIRRFS